MMDIGWVGTGVMGASMAGHLQKAGHNLSVFNRSREKAEALLSNGAKWCNSPAEVAKNSEIVFTIVGHPADVREVYLGENGILNAETPCSIVVDMTTSQPSLAKTLFEEAAKRVLNPLTHLFQGAMSGQEMLNSPSWSAENGRSSRRSFPFLNSWDRRFLFMGDPWERTAHQGVQPDPCCRKYDRGM